jgi:hypothetical protein
MHDSRLCEPSRSGNLAQGNPDNVHECDDFKPREHEILKFDFETAECILQKNAHSGFHSYVVAAQRNGQSRNGIFARYFD